MGYVSNCASAEKERVATGCYVFYSLTKREQLRVCIVFRSKSRVCVKWARRRFWFSEGIGRCDLISEHEVQIDLGGWMFEETGAFHRRDQHLPYV